MPYEDHATPARDRPFSTGRYNGVGESRVNTWNRSAHGRTRPVRYSRSRAWLHARELPWISLPYLLRACACLLRSGAPVAATRRPCRRLGDSSRAMSNSPLPAEEATVNSTRWHPAVRERSLRTRDGPSGVERVTENLCRLPTRPLRRQRFELVSTSTGPIPRRTSLSSLFP